MSETSPEFLEVHELVDFQKMFDSVVEHLGVDSVLLNNLFRFHLGCKQDGNWDVKKNADGTVYVFKRETSIGYKIGTEIVHVYDKESKRMVDKKNPILLKRMHKQESRSAGWKGKSNLLKGGRVNLK